METLGNSDLCHGEILVELVKAERWAEKNGEYDQRFAAFNKR